MLQNASSFGKDKSLAVVATMTPWHELPRIRHQVTRQLTRFYNVLYVELPFGSAKDRDSVERINDDLIVYRPKGLAWLAGKLRNNAGYFRRRYNESLARGIEARVRSLGYASAVLVNFQFDFPEIMSLPVFGRRIYLCNDEFQTQFRWWTRAMNRRAESDVISRADTCLAVSLPLLDKLKEITSSAELFLPGHEFDAADQAAAAASLRKRVGPIRVCYMGFINNRLRVDWLMELARDPEVALNLIGPIEGKGQFADLLAHSNVEHVDTLVGAALRKRLNTFDVFIMPYDATQAVVRAITAPNKLFQYLACGRPVVCAALPSLLPLPKKFVYVASDATQFVRAVHAAFEEDGEALAQSRLEFSSRNTWNVRGDHLHSILRRAETRGAS